MGFRLVIHNRELGEEAEPEVREFDQSMVTMGRHSSNEIQLAHPGTSRQHCKIVLEEGNYFLYDPGSANGTLLNGRKVPLKRNQLLKDDDLISIESYDIRFKTMDRVAAKGPGENTDEVALRVVREVLGALHAKSNPYFELVAGPQKGKVVELNKDVQQILIGRSETCDLSLPDTMISRRNSKIRRDWSGVVVFDMNSKNGTFVNGTKIKEQHLRDGDEVQIGETKMIFHNPKEAFAREMEDDQEHEISGEISAKPLVTVSHGALEQGMEFSQGSSSSAGRAVAAPAFARDEPSQGSGPGYSPVANQEGGAEMEPLPQKIWWERFTQFELIAMAIAVVVIIGGLIIILKFI